MGLCADADGLTPVPPAHPTCHSPCRTGFVDSTGTYRSCSPDGVMDGCIDGQQCVDGSCVMAGATAPSCASDSQCPEFQRCIASKCYSDCELDSDCDGARRCHRNVCRAPCAADGPTCPTGQTCELVDASHGFCVADVAPSSSTPHDQPVGTYEAEIDRLQLSATKPQATLTIRNLAPTAQSFVVVKVDHQIADASGQLIVQQTNPLPWLKVGASAATGTVATEYTVQVAAGGTATVVLDASTPAPKPFWNGAVAVRSATMGEQSFRIQYETSATGVWSGNAYYFNQFGTSNLDAYIANRNSSNAATYQAAVGNALVDKFAEMHTSSGQLREFLAYVQSTIDRSWDFSSTRALCPSLSTCVPFADPARPVLVYSTSSAAKPVPDGVTQMPMALELGAVDATHLAGRILSDQALQYAGDPRFAVSFASDPTTCASVGTGQCLSFVDTMAATISIGGRYRTTSDDRNCSKITPTAGNGFVNAGTPWIVPGFRGMSEVDSTTQRPYTYECRDSTRPLSTSTSGASLQNLAWSASNPIPDGRLRQRQLEVVDGFLVNQQTLYLLFRERFSGNFLPGDTEGFVTYGMMILERGTVRVDAPAPTSVDQSSPDARSSTVDLTATASCTPAMMQQALGHPAGSVNGLSQTDLNLLVGRLIDGVASAGNTAVATSAKVHYLCASTGLFDQGPSPAVPAACPIGSNIYYFIGNVPSDLSGLDCQKSGTCSQVLDQWAANASIALNKNLVSKCNPVNGVQPLTCDDDRYNLTAGKTFYVATDATATASTLQPILTLTDSAFRYKTQFQSRDGTNVGFTPSICASGGSNLIPYCYDPATIEAIAARSDCLLDVYGDGTLTGLLYPQTLSLLKQHLVRSFSFTQGVDSLNRLVVQDGFERLYSELLVMLGDDAYTRSFNARFDLANSSIAAFEGNLFEPNGVSLSGGIGYEMYSLYQAAQYYQLVLNRFYAMMPYIWAAVNPSAPSGYNFVTADSVVTYFPRVLRASAQRTRANSQIARRYQEMNRPDLARAVVARAYASAHLESVVFSRVLQRLVDASDAQHRDQIVQSLTNAARTYKAALLDMREAFDAISDQPTFYGLAPDYVPMPALDPSGPNAFEAALSRARASLSSAADKENVAISTTRDFDSSSAAFSSELVRIRNTYEDQLAALCGTMTGDDGRVYPAISTYADQSSVGRALGDPCGFVGNGTLSNAMAAVSSQLLELQMARNNISSLSQRIQNEQLRASAQCNIAVSAADFAFQTTSGQVTLEQQQRSWQLGLATADRIVGQAKTFVDMVTCTLPGATSAGDCGTKLPAAAAYFEIQGVQNAIHTAAEQSIEDVQRQVDGLTLNKARYQQQHACDALQADSVASISNMMLETANNQLALLRAQYALQTAASEVIRYRNEALRLLAEKQDAEQLSINVEAARNDPNQRIYRNDAVINADRTFSDAMRDAYRATRVYEYYTSTSYADAGKLYLIRLVSRGDYNLEAYLSGLEQAYYAFLETYGRPDARVDVLSLRDDILRIPQYDENRQPLSAADRVARFRAALLDSKWITPDGYITIPFATNFARLSPRTANHKIDAVEVELVGADVGDSLGRIYVQQSGTSAIRAVGGQTTYLRFPERLAVVNTFFNGVHAFSPDVYMNRRLRDLPYANSGWSLVINQVDEYANQDINLQSLSDVRVYVHYTDFTSL